MRRATARSSGGEVAILVALALIACLRKWQLKRAFAQRTRELLRWRFPRAEQRNSVLLSEDLQQQREIDGVRIVNPFRVRDAIRSAIDDGGSFGACHLG